MRSIGRNHVSGGVLVGALAFTAVAAFLLAGAGTFAVGSLSRANVEADYASAVNVADAGLNAIIRKISQDPSDASLVNHPDSPLTGSVPGVGTYSAYVIDDATGGAWVSPNDMRIISEGTVNGVKRKVSVRGARKSIFDEYAIFADKSLTLGGSGQSSGSTQIIGSVGMNNGPADPDANFNGALNSGAINGEFTMNGGATMSSGDNSGNGISSPDPVLLPTVSEMADALFGPNGLTWLQTNNANAKVMKLRSSDTTLAAVTGTTTMTLAQATLGDIACQFDSMGWTSATRTLTVPNGNGTPSSTNSNDSTSAAANVRRFANSVEGIQGLKTIFLPPGDYYFSSIDLKGGGIAMVLLTHLGRIRIWVDGTVSGNQSDDLSIPVIFTDLTPSKFRLFYNKCSSINMAGNSIFAGGFYAYNPACQTGPTMNFSGNSTIYGSVIAGAIDITGGTQIIFPNDGGGSDPTDFALWFGIKNGWKELPINDGGPTFNTGTSN